LFSTRWPGSVVLAHVVPSIKAFPYAFPMNSPEVELSQRGLAETELRKLAGDVFGPAAGVEIVVDAGDIHEQLLRIVEEKKADLVIMGTQGRRNLGRWFLGSVTERLLRKVPVPILTVSHSGEPKEHDVPSSLNDVLYATDLSDQSPAVAALAAGIAAAFGARLTIMNALEYQDFLLWGGTLVQLSEADRTTIVDDTKARLDELVKKVNKPGLKVDTVVTEGKAYQKILQYAEQNNVGLIVLNLQGKSLIERAALGSTAERVVRLAKAPVLSVPIPESGS
jgi:nucleotide-binding universal stress UspA family protein